MFRPALSLIALLCPAAVAVALAASNAPATDPRQQQLEQLGQALFHDPSLSRNGTQSCATCHDPEHAFTDPRENEVNAAVSVGDDGVSLGDRNTPTLAYAFLSPDFHKDAMGRYKGGQFWDGRADDLADQAGQPMLNPVEMGMPDRAAVVQRLRDNPDYAGSFAALFGTDALADVDRAFQGAALALAAYQSTDEFAPFDSKYDRWKRGQAQLTEQEEFGFTVFMTWNCRLCHQLQKQGVVDREPFTSYEFHNIGVPVNTAVRAANGLGPDFRDLGLSQRAGIDDPAQDGKVRIPTLRNIAVTGPYMRNGVFQDLRTAVIFYNKYPSRRAHHQINPETGAPWGEPEIDRNLSLAELQSGLMVDDRRIDALVAFLETLTDQRYEPLLEQKRAERQQLPQTTPR